MVLSSKQDQGENDLKPPTTEMVTSLPQWQFFSNEAKDLAGSVFRTSWFRLSSLHLEATFFFQKYVFCSSNVFLQILSHRDVYPRLNNSRLFGSFCCLNFGGLVVAAVLLLSCFFCCPCLLCCLELSFKNCVHYILFGWLPLCGCFFLHLFLRPSLFRISKVSKQPTWETFQHEGCLEKLIVALSKRVEEYLSNPIQLYCLMFLWITIVVSPTSYWSGVNPARAARLAMRSWRMRSAFCNLSNRSTATREPDLWGKTLGGLDQNSTCHFQGDLHILWEDIWYKLLHDHVKTSWNLTCLQGEQNLGEQKRGAGALGDGFFSEGILFLRIIDNIPWWMQGDWGHSQASSSCCLPIQPIQEGLDNVRCFSF